ncbi:MAG: heavy metal-responsive transcriptional regulator [Acidobacteriota bacterium]|jgi:DNA-binding transcriptional MerR regulator|nr:heavy metal-responsive transcriptional regulator [Acidobacteriota bacterium]
MNGTIQIGEAAKRTALSVDSIRFYERQELLPPPTRTEGGFRLYTCADLDRLRFIQQMQGLGFSLRQIKQLLDLRSHGIEACSAVRDLLRAKIGDIRAKINHLEELEIELAKDLRKCNRELSLRKSHKPCTCPILKIQ